jgi:YjbE family integral membrane protein
MHELWNHIVADFTNLGSLSALSAFGQVVLIDVMLAADNAIVVGALAAGLPPRSRHKVILLGIGAALVLRIAFALLVTQLLQLTGLVFAGGLLLLWVAWKLWRELRTDTPGEMISANAVPRSFAGAAWAVMVADVSMSIDNVLAVAGAARAHPGILAIGLVLSVALMGFAANVLARLIERWRWIAYIGLLVILIVAVRMIYDGTLDPSTGLLKLF